MLKISFFLLVFCGILHYILTGNAEQCTYSILSECKNGIELAFSLAGILCLWSGIMNICRAAGIAKAASKIFSPLLTRLFRGISPNGKAMEYITLNLVSNFLGLGNASTPLGISAMNELEKEEKSDNTATGNMIVFVVLNTASIQFIPTTVAALRLQYGSAQPLDILPCVWIVSALAAFFAVLTAKAMEKRYLKSLLPKNDRMNKIKREGKWSLHHT